MNPQIQTEILVAQSGGQDRTGILGMIIISIFAIAIIGSAI